MIRKPQKKSSPTPTARVRNAVTMVSLSGWEALSKEFLLATLTSAEGLSQFTWKKNITLQKHPGLYNPEDVDDSDPDYEESLIHPVFSSRVGDTYSIQPRSRTTHPFGDSIIPPPFLSIDMSETYQSAKSPGERFKYRGSTVQQRI